MIVQMVRLIQMSRNQYLILTAPQFFCHLLSNLMCHCRTTFSRCKRLVSMKRNNSVLLSKTLFDCKHLRYKIRADRPEEEIEEMKEQIKVLTEKIGTLRKEAALCDGIAARSKVIEEKFKTVREEKEKKEEQSHEHIRRSR